jgi:hypothetical protein
MQSKGRDIPVRTRVCLHLAVIHALLPRNSAGHYRAIGTVLATLHV